MSEKAHRQAAGQADASSYASLPEAVVSQSAQLSKQHRGHPLLRVSRSCRDAVLSSCAAVCVHADFNVPKPGPYARLLHRACCLARPGLEVGIHSWGPSNSVPQLLQPGIACGGWRNVHKLEVTNADSAHLFLQAFPALEELVLQRVYLCFGTLFSMLAAHNTCPLRSITLDYCTIGDAALEAAATALAQLPSLKAYHAVDRDVASPVASSLTALTSLEAGCAEAGDPPADTQLVKMVSHNRGFQSLATGPGGVLPAELLQSLLMSCSTLTRINLYADDIGDEVLDILLQYGPNITGVALGDQTITTDRANHPCSWQRLRLGHQHNILAGLAYLPVRSVQELKTTNDADMLQLPVSPLSKDLPLLQRAVSNLKACPAWQKQPAARILLYTPDWYIDDIPDMDVITELLSTLSPLRGPHLQQLGISLKVDFGQQEVQVIASSVGRGLKSLALYGGFIKPSFWPALSQHLPNLRELKLKYTPADDIPGITAYLRTVTQPFTLYIGLGVLPDDTLAHDAWQLHNVTVVQEWPRDAFDCYFA